MTAIFTVEICIWMYACSTSVMQLLNSGICSVALVVLFSDSLNAVWPVYSSDQWKVVGLIMCALSSRREVVRCRSDH